MYESIVIGFKYLNAQGIEVPLDLHARARNVGAIKADGIGDINSVYHDAITAAMLTYFEGGNVTGPRNAFRQATTDAFFDAFYRGWQDGGGTLPPEDEALDWLNARTNQEYGHIDMLFQNMKELRKDTDFDYFSWVNARADGYTGAVLSVYNAAVLLAKKGKMLTWHLGNTETHCPTCISLNNGRRRASWYISHNYIPRQPGADMDCGGYNCDCSLTDDQGNEVTL